MTWSKEILQRYFIYNNYLMHLRPNFGMNSSLSNSCLWRAYSSHRIAHRLVQDPTSTPGNRWGNTFRKHEIWLPLHACKAHSTFWSHTLSKLLPLDWDTNWNNGLCCYWWSLLILLDYWSKVWRYPRWFSSFVSQCTGCAS